MKLFLILLSVNLFSISHQRLPKASSKTREPSGFSLARLQKQYDEDYETAEESSSATKSSMDGSRRRDEVVNDAKCLQKCNNNLNIGMDMVNAHMAFGSIDVPSVIDKRDLELFCLLDFQHSQCIDECGYSVQFNLREYVCRNRFPEMLQHLPCYAKAAPILIRHCRPRCGGYKPLIHSHDGYSKRFVPMEKEMQHQDTYWNLQNFRYFGNQRKNKKEIKVNYWMKDFKKQSSSKIPLSCRKIQCQDFKLSNCANRLHRRLISN